MIFDLFPVFQVDLHLSWDAYSCYKVWKKFIKVPAVKRFNPESTSQDDVLDFLQSALNKFSYSSIRVQVLAISALMKVQWAEDALIAWFMRAELKIRTSLKSVFPKWDPPLVLQALNERSLLAWWRYSIVLVDNKKCTVNSNNLDETCLRKACFLWLFPQMSLWNLIWVVPPLLLPKAENAAQEYWNRVNLFGLLAYICIERWVSDSRIIYFYFPTDQKL